MQDDLDKILVSEAEISERIHSLAREINETYGDNEVAVVAIINGAIIFTADLIRQLKLNLRLDCIRVSSYRDDTSPVQEQTVSKPACCSIRKGVGAWNSPLTLSVSSFPMNL